MANTITEVLPKILAQGVLALRQQAIGPRLVNRDLDSLAAAKGNVINVPIPSAIAARAVTPAVAFATNVDSTPTSAAVTLDRWMEAPFQLNDNDFVSADGMIIPMQASEAIKSLANDADQYLWGKHVAFFGAVGTPGTTPFNGSMVVGGNARKLLNKQLAPMDNRFGVLDPDAEANFLLNTNIIQADQRGDAQGLIAGTIGTKLGIAWYMDQNITTYTPGTGWVTGWALSTVGAAAGDTTLNIINATASGTIKIGDIFTVNGGTQQYVVTANATASATVQRTIAFYPALASAAATGAAITVIGTAYVVNLAAHRDAFAWASRPLAGVFNAGNIFQAPTDPISGIALRLELSRQYKQETFSFDYLAGANVVRRELGVKILG
ncbi:MAG: hypothetical protein IPK12_23520 [Gemmatimonadetes bacterium]|nr:hypothetical protein [Gemmatimonadota bacterium]